MQNKYFTVGPSQTYSKLPDFLNLAIEQEICSLSHRSERFMQLFSGLSLNLKSFLQIPQNYSVFYAGCATEWMERILQNCSQEKTLHFSSGVFSHRFFEFAKELKRDAKEVLCDQDFTFHLEDSPTNFAPELVCLTHNETSSGVVLPKKFLNGLKTLYPKALFAIDIVSSVPVSDVDFSMFDCIFLSVQKGLGLPAGLGVVFVSPQALEISEKIYQLGKYIGFRHGFSELNKHYLINQTPETPNVLNMFLLNEVVKDMNNAGLEILKNETEEKAEIIFNTISNSSLFEIVVKDEAFRSKTTIVAKAKNGSKQIIESLKAKGLFIGAGYGKDKDKYIRIANFPAHTLDMVKELTEELKNLS